MGAGVGVGRGVGVGVGIGLGVGVVFVAAAIPMPPMLNKFVTLVQALPSNDSIVAPILSVTWSY